MKNCPSIHQLKALIEGQLDQQDCLSVGGHVDSCENCQRVLDGLCQSEAMKILGAEVVGLPKSPGILNTDEFSYESLHSRSESLNRTSNESQSDAAPDLEQIAVQRLVERLREQPEPTTLVTSQKSSVPTAATGELPQRLKEYELLELIGEGATGCLYRAKDLILDRIVAIKILKSQFFRGSATWQRFVREARAAAALRSDHVVTVYQVEEGDAHTPAFIVMELMSGGSLSRRVRSVELATGVDWIIQTACGLKAAHDAGIVHRDIKPSNLLWDDTTSRVKIADFGLARIEDSSEQLTSTGMLAGTPSYMSPEQIQDPTTADSLSDLYSLGVVFYEILTRELPFRGTTRRILEQVIHDAPLAPRLLNDRIPRDLETICLKAISKERVLRYQSADEFANDLQRWLDGMPVQARPIGIIRRLGKWARRNVNQLVIVVVLVLVLLGGLADWFQKPPARVDVPQSTNSKTVPSVLSKPTAEQLFGKERLAYLELLVSSASQHARSTEQREMQRNTVNSGLDVITEWKQWDQEYQPLAIESDKICRIAELAWRNGRLILAKRLLQAAEPEIVVAKPHGARNFITMGRWLQLLIEDELEPNRNALKRESGRFLGVLDIETSGLSVEELVAESLYMPLSIEFDASQDCIGGSIPESANDAYIKLRDAINGSQAMSDTLHAFARQELRRALYYPGIVSNRERDELLASAFVRLQELHNSGPENLEVTIDLAGLMHLSIELPQSFSKAQQAFGSADYLKMAQRAAQMAPSDCRVQRMLVRCLDDKAKIALSRSDWDSAVVLYSQVCDQSERCLVQLFGTRLKGIEAALLASQVQTARRRTELANEFKRRADRLLAKIQADRDALGLSNTVEMPMQRLIDSKVRVPAIDSE